MKWGVRRRNYIEAKSAAKNRYNKSLDDAMARSDSRTEKNFSSNKGAMSNGFIKGKDNRKIYRQLEGKNVKQYKTDVMKAKHQYKSDIRKAKQVYKQSDKPNALVMKNEIKNEFKRQQHHINTKRAVEVGRNVANSYLSSHQYTLNGKPMQMGSGVTAIVNRMLDYKYMKDTFK